MENVRLGAHYSTYYKITKYIVVVQLVMSSSLQPHGLQHTRLPCPAPSPRACSNSCPLSWWCHWTTSSSVTPFPCPQSFPVSGGQNTGASVSASVLSTNIQDWLPLGLTGLILLSKGLSRVFSSTRARKYQFFCTQPSLWSNSHNHNTVRLWVMPCRSIQDRWVTVESSDKTLFAGRGNGKPFQYSCLENPMKSRNNNNKYSKDLVVQREKIKCDNHIKTWVKDKSKTQRRDFPHCPLVRTLHFHCSISGQGTRSYMPWCVTKNI